MSVRILLVKIPVPDLEEGVALYREVFGWEATFVAEAYGWAQLQAGEVPIALYVPGKGGGNRTPGGSVDVHLGLEPGEFDRVVEKAREKGCLVDGRVHTGDDGTTFVEIRDPGGNLLRVFRL